MRSFQLATLVLGVSLAAAADPPKCSARCGSEIGFVSLQGPELLISYDGDKLTVPQHCREEDCQAQAKEIADLKEMVKQMVTRINDLESKQAEDHSLVLDKITKSMAVDGGWSDWSAFTSCSTACGDGTKMRRRSCTNPRPKGGGATCQGPSTETASCNLKECDIVRDVHCEFTVDNYIQQIFVDGVDITAKVSGNLHDWPSKKTYTFPSSARSFAARVNDAEAGCHNGGFAIKCSTQGTGGGAQWNMDSNQRQKWLVASSDSFGSTPPDAHGHHWYETDYPTTNGRWGTPRAGDTQYADSVIGVDDMCGPEHEASSHNKVGDCFACCAPERAK